MWFYNYILKNMRIFSALNPMTIKIPCISQKKIESHRRVTSTRAMSGTSGNFGRMQGTWKAEEQNA
jgi:hypothetical protein